MVRREGSLAEMDVHFDAEEAADVAKGRAKAKLKFKEHNISLQNISKSTTAADIDAAALAEERHKAAAVDVTAIGERMAATKGRKKAEEHIEAAGKNIFKKTFRRQTASGQIEKFRRQEAEEIYKRGRLLENREKSYEIVDEAIEAMEDASMRAASENPEIYTGAAGAALDAAGADLIAALVTGDIKTREEFDERFNRDILPSIKGAATVPGEKLDGKLYGNNMYDLAVAYKRQFEEKLEIVNQEFGPEQKEIVQKYLHKVLKLDVSLAKQGADLYELKSNSKWLRGMEAAINWTQSPVLSSMVWKARKYRENAEKNKVSRAIDRIGGLTFGNPVLYAYIGNRLGYMAASGLGVAAVKGLGIGAAATVGIVPGLIAAAGAGAGAGLYMGIRAAVEHYRGIRRREEQATLGQLKEEETPQRDARIAAAKLNEITDKLNSAGLITEGQKSEAAKIIATLNVQDKQKRNLFKVGKGEGEEYQTNFLAIQDLRRAIKEFVKTNNAQAEPARIDEMVAAAERQILEKIEKRDKELLAETRKQGWKVGWRSGVVAFGAACLAPGIGKILKGGWNKTLDILGSHKFHWDTSKVTFTEQIWHSLRSKGANHYQGEYAKQVMLGTGGRKGDYISYPDPNKSGGMDIIKDKDHLDFVVNNQKVYTARIDGSGHINESDLMQLKNRFGWNVERTVEHIPPVAAAASAKGNFESWISHFKSSGHKGIDVTEVHTKGFYDNPEVDESGNFINPHTHNVNELRLHVTKLDNGGVKIDCSNLKDQGSWRIAGETVDQPHMLALRGEGKLKFVFIPDSMHPHDAIVCDMDSAGNLIIPQGGKMHDLIDPATGQVRSGVVYGTARVEQGSQGLDLYWINAQKGQAGLGMDYGAGAAGAPAGAGSEVVGYRLTPPVSHEFGEPWVLAGWRKETDEDVEEYREARKEKEKAKEEARKRKEDEKRRKRELKEQAEIVRKQTEEMLKIPPEERYRLAAQEIQEMFDQKKENDKVFEEICIRYILTDDQRKALRKTFLKAHLGMTDQQIDEELAKKKQEFETVHASAESSGGGGGGHDEQGKKKPAAPEKTKPKFDEAKALREIMREKIQEKKAKEVIRESTLKPDRAILTEINNRKEGRKYFGLHLEFEAEDKFVKGEELEKTNNFAEKLYSLLKAEGLDPLKYRGIRVKVKFTENPPFDRVVNNAENLITIPVQPGSSAEEVFVAMLHALGERGELTYKFKQIDIINKLSTNKEPWLDFAYEPLLTEVASEQKIRDYAADVQSKLREHPDVKNNDKYKHSTVKIHLTRGRAPKEAMVDVHGNLVMEVDYEQFGSNPKAAADIVARQMKKKLEGEEPKVGRKFLQEINNDPDNKEPHVGYDMDDEIIKDMGEAEAKNYIINIAIKVNNKLQELKAANGVRNRAMFEAQILTVKVTNRGDYHGKVERDGTWSLAFPPKKPINEIVARINNQFEEIRRSSP
ncbi:MAG: hypothetical protein M1383_03135 [Patescibacteria group bacterium]|nr:hypothetical protein [Patescibacteria group bacterium]